VTLDIAGFLQTLEGRGHHGREPSGRRGVKKSHHRHRRLLRTRCERPHSAPQKRNELAAGVEIGPVALRQRLDHQLSCAHYPQESRENERTFAVLDEADNDCESAVIREPDEDADHCMTSGGH
jgi:hypothetical protein